MRPELLDGVAIGGSIATRLRFRVSMLTGEFEIPPRSLLVVTHRSDWDIPLTTNIYWPGRMYRRGGRPVFVARDDMFLPGFLAGYPPGLPLAARRLLARVDVGRGLRRGQLALPIASAARCHLADVVRDDPAVPLAELPPELAGGLRARARRLGRPEPTTAADVDDGAYADLLWTRCERADLPGLDGFWSRRQAVGRRDFEALVDHVDRGGVLAIYPEGRPSPDGAIGPFERGLGLLVRRAAPDAVIPIALAYDPLPPGRTRAYVAVGRPEPPPSRKADEAILARLRALMPLTAGQVAAHALLHERDPEAVAAAALEEERPAEPRLLELLGDAVRAARERPRDLVARLDLEFRSARGL